MNQEWGEVGGLSVEKSKAVVRQVHFVLKMQVALHGTVHPLAESSCFCCFGQAVLDERRVREAARLPGHSWLLRFDDHEPSL